MERSRESIRAAEIMLENEMFAISMNRVYYSIANIQRLGWILRERVSSFYDSNMRFKVKP